MHNFSPMLRVFALTSVLSAGITALHAQSFPVDSVQSNGARNKRINLVFVSDGYRAAQLTTFKTNVTTINNGLMATVPFTQYKTFFNTYLVNVPSDSSGAKHPGTAADEASSGGQPVANPTTYFSSTFDYASIHRLLVPTSNTAVFNILSANLPQYNQAFVLVNSPYYGGSGGVFATSSTHTSSAEIAIHEIGHSFAALSDEYWAGDGYARESTNMTQTSDPITVKWKSWIGVNNVGVYPYGTSGNAATWYRPHQLCKMQYLGYPFCPVCVNAFVDKIHALVNMIDSYSPTTTSFTLSDTNVTVFSVTHLQTLSNTISAKWYLNGSATPFATGATISVPYAALVPGGNTIRATVYDSTSFSRTYLPAIGYANSVTWTVNKPVLLSLQLTSQSKPVKNPLSSSNFKVFQDAAAHAYQLNYASDNGGTVAITVTNANGTGVLQKNLGKSSGKQRYAFDLHSQPAGIYFVTIKMGEEVYTTKILAL